MSEGHVAWSLLQLAELLRTVDEQVRHAMPILDEVAAGLCAQDGAARVGAGELARLREAGEALADLASRIHAIGDELPFEAVELDVEGLAAVALEDLAGGIIDPARARLAARTARAHDGWPALGRALRTSDAHTAWEGIGVGELLGSFRGAEPELVDRVLSVAELPADATFPACEPAAIGRLAVALEEHALAGG